MNWINSLVYSLEPALTPLFLLALAIVLILCFLRANRHGRHPRIRVRH